EVGSGLRREVEPVHCLPAVSRSRLQFKHIAVAAEAVDAVRGCLFEARLETERRGRTGSAKADIGDEFPLRKLDQGQSMRQWCRLSFFPSPKDPAAKGDDRKSQSGQYIMK